MTQQGLHLLVSDYKSLVAFTLPANLGDYFKEELASTEILTYKLMQNLINPPYHCFCYYYYGAQFSHF